jgi:hypothetical protein
MLGETEMRTKYNISLFEDALPLNPKMKPEQLFDSMVWIDIEEFLAKMAKNTGLRDRVLNEYFNILKNCGDIEINRRNSHCFRNALITEQYLVQHPELK